MTRIGAFSEKEHVQSLFSQMEKNLCIPKFKYNINSNSYNSAENQGPVSISENTSFRKIS